MMDNSNSNKIVPPHLNAEVYRTNTTGTDSLLFLDYIRIEKDGSILVGSSELSGRFWNGGVSVFKTVNDAQKLSKDSKKNISLHNGTADGCFLENSSKVLLCEDNGAVSIWTINDDVWKTWNQEMSIAEHDDGVLALDCLVPGEKYVTAGADGNAKVWDINEMICINNYAAAHNKPIYGLAVRSGSSTSFATASADEYVSLWDKSVFKPVQDLVKDDCGVRCIQWLDENQLLYGNEAGMLRMMDVRNSQDRHTLAEFPAPVHRLAVQPETNRVAICCDNRIVTVCEITEGTNYKEVYEDRSQHSHYVRGLAWDGQDKNILFTSGWDGELKTHKLLP